MELRTSAPDGLVPWIREQKDIDWPNYLLYKHGWTRDGITGLREACADAVCTACGERMKLGKSYGVACTRGNASFGVVLEDEKGCRVCGSGMEARCPECGAKVTVLHTSAAHGLTRYCWPMSFERDGKNLICYLWRAERDIDRSGEVRFYAVPWEAYVFGEKKATVYKKWLSGYCTGCHPSGEWESLSKFEDRAYDIDIVYCPEGIAEATRGTWMENSKLEIYMAVKSEYRFPIVWLRLYQRRHNAETLMTCGAAKLVAGIIAEEKKAWYYYADWTRRVDCLKDLDWKKNRPTEMLRINKQELEYFRKLAQKDGTRRLRVIEQARKRGMAIRPGDEDGVWGIDKQLGLLEAGILPAKARRYLEKQKRRYGRDWELNYLEDYWRMARELRLDLNDREIRWPQNLTSQHDQLAERQKLIEDEKLKKKFEERFARMSRYSWESGGILIRPAQTEAELRAEGKALHHCVGTYAARHAAGELTIFFVRRAEEPDKPWFTLNFNEKTMSVTENRGDRNCARTPEVSAFEQAWLAWARAGCKQNKQEVHAA